LQEYPGRRTSEALEFILQLKESVALEGMAVLFQAVCKCGSPSGFFPCRSSPVAGIVIAASEPVTAEPAQQGGNRADNSRPGSGIHERRH
jgi:hypothetical protein